KNESSASKKNRAGKVKKASRKRNVAQAARQNTAMLNTRQRLEGINDAFKHAPRDEKGNMIGDPPADLSAQEKKTYTKQEKAALDATIAEIEAKAAHELAKLEAKKKFHVDDKTRKGIMLDTDTMTLQMDSLSQQKSAWEEYGRRQQLGDQEAMLVANKVAALQKKADDLQEKKAEILDERYRQQWVEDGNVNENGVLTSSFNAISGGSLMENIVPDTMSVGEQLSLFTGMQMSVAANAQKGADKNHESSFNTERLDNIVDCVETSLKGGYIENLNITVDNYSTSAIGAMWIEYKRDIKQNPQRNPEYNDANWIHQPSIGTLAEEQASYERLYKQEQKLFELRYDALNTSMMVQNAMLKTEKDGQSSSDRHEAFVAKRDAEAWAAVKETWRDNMAKGSDFCEDYFINENDSLVLYTAAEMEERKKIYAGVIAERGDTDSMELAQERTELMNTKFFVPPEKMYANDADSSYGDDDEEEEPEQGELEAKRTAELKELREAKKEPQQSATTKYVYQAPESGLEQRENEDQASYTARNKSFLKLHPKLDYVQWQVNSLTVQLLPLRHSAMVGKAVSKEEKAEHSALEKKLLALTMQLAELNEQQQLLITEQSSTGRAEVNKEKVHEKMLERKAYASQIYASQATAHSEEFRSAAKQAKAYEQKLKDWQNTCTKKNIAFKERNEHRARVAAEKRAAIQQKERIQLQQIEEEEALAAYKEEGADEMANSNADLKELEKKAKEKAAP
ncbi:MAG: hypothetical protein RR209_00780, partial [Angelakisella sp.]